jgi:ClpP class serine protease
MFWFKSPVSTGLFRVCAYSDFLSFPVKARENKFVVVERLTLELLRGAWLIQEEALSAYSELAIAYLSGDQAVASAISKNLFSKINIPDAPGNIAMVVLNGVMTKADICDAPGTRSIAQQIAAAAKDPSFDAIILYSESVPGGQVDGTKELADVIAAARMVKPVIGAISGMSCSAGIWANSQCTESYATSPTDIVGCIGVMAQMQKPKGDAAAGQRVAVYSDLSPDKNLEERDH